MIEVSLEHVEMPEIKNRKFQYTANKDNINSFWYIIDTETNKRVSKGKFEDIQFKCHYLSELPTYAKGDGLGFKSHHSNKCWQFVLIFKSVFPRQNIF